jgi:hypothetical protein
VKAIQDIALSVISQIGPELVKEAEKCAKRYEKNLESKTAPCNAVHEKDSDQTTIDNNEKPVNLPLSEESVDEGGSDTHVPNQPETSGSETAHIENILTEKSLHEEDYTHGCSVAPSFQDVESDTHPSHTPPRVQLDIQTLQAFQRNLLVSTRDSTIDMLELIKSKLWICVTNHSSKWDRQSLPCVSPHFATFYSIP